MTFPLYISNLQEVYEEEENSMEKITFCVYLLNKTLVKEWRKLNLSHRSKTME